MRHLLSVVCVIVAAGCAPGLKTVKVFDDGTKQVGVGDLGIQMRVPGDALLTSAGSSSAVIQWAGNYRAIRIERRRDTKHANVDALVAGLQSSKTRFTLGESGSFETGFEVSYTYMDGLRTLSGYEAEATVGDTTYGCYLSSPGDEATVQKAREACRSIASAN